MTNRLVSLFLAFASLSPAFGQARDRLDLGGEWSLQYGETTAVVTLPGTMDTNRQGTPSTNRQETTRLTRLFSYTGPATYSRTVNIPQRWKNRDVTLYLERTKFTKVYVDGAFVDSCNRISTPHVYHLGQLKPGAHQLTIVVDNGSGTAFMRNTRTPVLPIWTPSVSFASRGDTSMPTDSLSFCEASTTLPCGR